MKLNYKFAAIGAAVALCAAGLAFGAQVAVDTYLRTGGSLDPKSGRSSGLYIQKQSNALSLIENGVSNGNVGKGFYEDFTKYGNGDLTATNGCWQTDGTVCDYTDATANFVTMPSGNRFVVYPIQTSTAGLDMDAGYLDISGDDTNTEGFEIYTGNAQWPGTAGRTFVVGTDPAFATCATVNVADADAATELWFGFRNSNEVRTATFNNYTDYAVIGVSAGAADIKTETEKTGAGETTTDTTLNLADGVARTFCTKVSAAGVVTFSIDGAPATSTAFTFTDATALMPFIFFVNAAALTGEVKLTKWYAGYQD